MLIILKLSTKGLVRGLENANISKIHQGCSTGKSTKVPCKQIKSIQSKELVRINALRFVWIHTFKVNRRVKIFSYIY